MTCEVVIMPGYKNGNQVKKKETTPPCTPPKRTGSREIVEISPQKNKPDREWSFLLENQQSLEFEVYTCSTRKVQQRIGLACSSLPLGAKHQVKSVSVQYVSPTSNDRRPLSVLLTANQAIVTASRNHSRSNSPDTTPGYDHKTKLHELLESYVIAHSNVVNRLNDLFYYKTQGSLNGAAQLGTHEVKTRWGHLYALYVDINKYKNRLNSLPDDYSASLEEQMQHDTGYQFTAVNDYFETVFSNQPIAHVDRFVSSLKSTSASEADPYSLLSLGVVPKSISKSVSINPGTSRARAVKTLEAAFSIVDDTSDRRKPQSTNRMEENKENTGPTNSGIFHTPQKQRGNASSYNMEFPPLGELKGP